MDVPRVRPGESFTHTNRKVYSVGDTFRNARVFKMRNNPAWFARIPGIDLIGRIVREDAVGLKYGDTIAVRIAQVNSAVDGSRVKYLIEFAVVKAGETARPVSEPPKPVPAPAKKERVVVRTEADLLKLANQLRKDTAAGKIGPELKDEIKAFVAAARTAIIRYGTATRFDGWTRALVADYALYRNLSERVDSLLRKIGEKPLGLPVPRYTGSLYRLPGGRSTIEATGRSGDMPERSLLPGGDVQGKQPAKPTKQWPTERPADNPFAGQDLGKVQRACRDFLYYLECSGVWSWKPAERETADQLVGWLVYLTRDRGTTFRQEYPDCSDWSDGLIEQNFAHFRKFLQRYAGLTG